MNKTITYSQIKSCIGSTEDIRATLVGLGLTKMHKSVTKIDSKPLRGMLAKVSHLVKIED